MRSAIAPREITKVAVLGLGLIGGSVALRCQQRGLTVAGYDADPDTRAAASVHFPVADSVAAAVSAPGVPGAGADLVVLAVPLKAMAEVAAQLAPVVEPGMTITDVGSLKAPVRSALAAAGLADYYVGAHPMAGNEHSGFAAADPMLLVGANWVLTQPVGVSESATAEESAAGGGNSTGGGAVSQARYGEVYHWVTDTFDATVVEMDDAEHDKTQALTSGLPHMLAVELLNQVAAAPSGSKIPQLTAGSFRDGTRVAFTDPDRTMALITHNADNVVPLLHQVAADLTGLADQLATGQDVSQFFHQADGLRRDTASGTAGRK